MSDTVSWLMVVLLIFSIAERFGTLSDMVVLTNLLISIVAIVWGYLTYKKYKNVNIK